MGGFVTYSECGRFMKKMSTIVTVHESCGFPEVASAVLLQAVDMESVVVNTEYLSVGTTDLSASEEVDK